VAERREEALLNQEHPMRRSVFFAIVGAVLLSFSTSAQQLQSGRNVNASGGPATKDVTTGVPILGDPYLQRQNEPSMACSVRNPLNCLLGANDYRTVDYPNPAGGKVTGDAWLGAFWTRDGGQSWRSNLIPGFPQDVSSTGANVPMKGFEAAADPTVRPGSNGLLYYSGVAFNRSAISGNTSGAEGKEGVLFLATFIDDNNTQQIDTPFRMVRVTPVAFSTPEKFTDKPWLAVDIPRGGSSMCTIPAGNGVPAQTFPAGNVYMAYTVFQGDGAALKSRLMFARSTDCGQTFEHAMKLSESFKINQSATIAIHPTTGQVVVAWREFATKNNKNIDGIVVARSDDFGKSFAKGVRVGELTHADGTSLSLDQPSLPTTEEPNFRMFRTNTYPSMCVASNGTVYLAWAQRRVHTSGDARILYSTSANGNTWSVPAPIDNFAARGHQGMPALACGGNKVTAIWYDQREDALGWLLPNQGGWGPFMADPIALPLSRTIDVRAAEAVAGQPFGASIRISRYQYGLYSDANGPRALQLEYNLENLPLFGGGKMPFMGDYIDVAAAPAMLPAAPYVGGAGSSGNGNGNGNGNANGQAKKAASAAELAAPNGWAFNTSATAAPVFHAAWADNRDVRAPGALTTFEAPSCNPGTQAGTKNQNIYTTRLSPGVAAGALGNARPYGLLDRAFSVYVQNTTGAAKLFSLTIATQLPSNITASFSQFAVANASPPIPYPMLTLQVNVAPYSGVARTVFVHTTTSGVSLVPIRVDVDEIVTPPAVPTQTSLVINPDPTNPAPIDAAVAAGLEEHLPVLTPEQMTQYLNPNFFNPNFFNPNFFNPNFFNPNFINANQDEVNPNFINPNFINPNFINPNFINPNFFNPNFINPNFINPNFINPNFFNPNFFNQSMVTELNWTVESGGNTASSYLFRYLASNPLPPEWSVQLLIYRLYRMPAPASTACGIETLVVEEKLVDIQNPNFINAGTPIDFANPNFINSALSGDLGNATFALGDGDAASIKLRIAHDGTFNPETVTATVIAGAVDSDDAANNITAPAATLSIVPAVPLEGTTGAPYAYQFASVGGAPNAPRTWSVQGGTVPPGLTLSASGLLSGTPLLNSAGSYPFTVAVTDGTQTVQLLFTVAVYNPLAITTAVLSSGVSGDPYSMPLAATGGKTPYQWSASGLPAGIVLSPAGVLSGSTAQPGLFPVVATVVDSGNPTRSASRAFTLAIGPRMSFVAANQPTNTPYMDPITPNVIVLVTDGNNVPLAGKSVTLGFGSNPTGATLVGVTTVLTNPAGQATFSNVRPSHGGTFTLVPKSFTVAGPASSAFTVTPLSATAFDAIGDNAVVDLASGTVVTDGQKLTLTAKFGPGFDSGTWAAVFGLDTDQNRATGNPGPLTGGGLDEQATGVDYFVWLYPNFDAGSPARAQVYKYLGPSSFSSLGTFPVLMLVDGYTALIPLSTFADDGLLNFKVTSAKQLSANGFTGLLDSAADVDLAPATITPAGIGPHQSVTSKDAFMWTLNGVPDQQVAQVITPSISGLLVELRTEFAGCDVTIDFQGVSGGMPNGISLLVGGAQTFTFGQIQTVSNPFHKVVFSAPISVTAGTPIAIVFGAPVSCGIAFGPDADFYSGGSASFKQGAGSWAPLGSVAGYDLPFQIKIKP
jgi:hypothetical protein